MRDREIGKTKSGATVGLIFHADIKPIPVFVFPSFSPDKAPCLLQSCAASRHNQYVGDDDTFADCF